jgi:hypothetical protein
MSNHTRLLIQSAPGEPASTKSDTVEQTEKKRGVLRALIFGGERASNPPPRHYEG